MRESISEFSLDIVNAGEVQRFEANEAGVAYLKVLTEQEAEEFVFLRKGEDFGGFVTQLFEAASLGVDCLQDLINAYAHLAPELLKVSVKEALKNIDELLKIYLIITGIKEKWKEISEKQFLEFGHIFPFLKRKRKPILQLLCSPDERNEGARLGWEKGLHQEVRHYKDPKQAGNLRIYLTERKFVMFFRTPTARFFGLQGKIKAQSSVSKSFSSKNGKAPKCRLL